MVHNGIEYGDMQLIAEAYSLLKGGLNLSNEELAQTFTEWNNGELSSYLIDITKDIFTKKDEDGNYLVDVILDEAANKGTGKWTSQSALDLGEPLSLITESVFARYISSLKEQRVAASKVLSGPQAQPAGDKGEFIEKVRRALYLGKIVFLRSGLLSCVRRLKRQLGFELRRNREDFPCWLHHPCAVLAEITMLMPKIRKSLTCCWLRTSSKLPMTTSRRCVMSLLMQYRTVSRFRPSLLRLPITIATVPLFCLRT